jgi:hypothetical protein
MHKSATKCNETIGKWYKNKHGASKIIDTLETYQELILSIKRGLVKDWERPTKRAITAIIMHSDKTSLREA